MSLTYHVGDATAPIGPRPIIIAHITNNLNAWGAGFVLAISRLWNLPEREYLSSKPELGMVQVVEVELGLYVANMCAQNGFPTRARPVAVDYEALGTCLDYLAEKSRRLGASIACPRIGCGIGGGRWATVEALLTQRLVARGVGVTVYDLPVVE